MEVGVLAEIWQLSQLTTDLAQELGMTKFDQAIGGTD